MQIALKQLSAAALRKLLIEETRALIDCLDQETYDELDARLSRLKQIHRMLDERERVWASPLGPQ